jgi:hypothetical protein
LVRWWCPFTHCRRLWAAFPSPRRGHPRWLPELEADLVRTRIRAAWALTDAELAEQRLELLASELDRTWPDAAASLREGMTETLTLTRLGITGQLARTLCSTNPCESMIEIVRYPPNVKHWQDGDMPRRWTLALTYVEMALMRADRLTATERAMASTVRDRPRPHPWRFQLSCSASPMMMPSGPRRKQSR